MSDNRLWHATLNPSSPRYRDWRKIFESDEIPLINSVAHKARLGDEEDTVYLLNWFEIIGDESTRMLQFFADKFKCTEDEVEKQFDHDGHIPIRTSDVTIIYKLAAFL